jgi:DNA topoisomerase VI subunit B
MSTGQPLDVTTAQAGSSTITACRLDIDIHKNEPRVLMHERRPNAERWQGSEVSVLIEGNWTTYRVRLESSTAGWCLWC